MRGGKTLFTIGIETWKRRCWGSTPFSFRVLEDEIRVDGIARITEPPAGIAEANLFHAVPDLEPPGIGGVARILALNAVVLGRRVLHDLKLRMRGEHLEVHAADPMAPRTDLAVRHGEQIAAKRRAKRLKDLLRRIKRNAAHQEEFVALHPMLHRLSVLAASIQCAWTRETKAKAMKRLFGIVLSCAIVALAGAAEADSWPSRPIKLIVPTGPGAATDVMARLLADGVSRTLGQTVFVENIPGASGILAHEAAARAAPDGYTLLFTNSSGMAINLISFKKLPYDPTRDFTAVALVCDLAPQMLSVNANLPVSSVGALIAYGKANPGKLSIAFDNTAGAAAFGAKLFNKRRRTRHDRGAVSFGRAGVAGYRRRDLIR